MKKTKRTRARADFRSMSPPELTEILRLHSLWMRRDDAGERADLRGLDIRFASLVGARLDGARLDGTNLCVAVLCGASISGASLSGANFSDAYLDGVDFDGANLQGCIGNMRELKTIQVERYCVSYTSEIIQIGCENHTIEEWRSFSDDEIAGMDIGALEWWRKWRSWLFKTIEMSPAKPTGNQEE